MKVVSARVPDSALSSEAVRRIKSAFTRAMLRGVIRILDSWEAASPRHEESCAEVASDSKSQEVLFDNPMPSGYRGEGEVVKRYLQDAAEEAAKDDIGLLLAKKPCEVVAYEEEADTPVEEKVDMPSEECEDSKPADDTICYEEPCISTLEASSHKGEKARKKTKAKKKSMNTWATEEPSRMEPEPEPEPVLAKNQHAMLEPVTEERIIESACAEPTAGREPDEVPPDLEPSPCTAPDAETLCEAPCEGVPEDFIVAVGDDGMCDKMSENLRSLNWRSCKGCSALISLTVCQAATEDGEFKFVKKLAK